MSLLGNNAGLTIPDSVHWVGSHMDTSRTFRNIHSIPLMKNKNQLDDYLHRDMYLSGTKLFKVNSGLGLTEMDNPKIKKQLSQKLSAFKSKSTFAIANDRIRPGVSDVRIPDKYQFMTRYDTLFQRIDSLQLTVDEQFQKARYLAFDGHYETARAITGRLLLHHPDYHDVRLLEGRTFAWQGEYSKARTQFNQVIEKDPSYYDSYSALSDLEYWDNNLEKALEVIETGLKYHPRYDQFWAKKIKILVELEQPQKARDAYSKLEEINPRHEALQTYDNIR